MFRVNGFRLQLVVTIFSGAAVIGFFAVGCGEPSNKSGSEESSLSNGAQATTNYEFVTCGDADNGFEVCSSSKRLPIQNVEPLPDKTSGKCAFGSSWKFLPGHSEFLVTNGCYGVFRLTLAKVEEVLCANEDDGFKLCSSRDGLPILKAELVSEISQERCVFGSSWKFLPGREQFLVTNGCRGVFRLTLASASTSRSGGIGIGAQSAPTPMVK